MKKVLIAIENDLTLDRADYTRGFIRKYDGEVVVMTNFNTKSRQEIFKNVSTCTDIAVQTCFIGGSNSQLEEMIGLLSKIPHTINVYIAYIGGDSPTDLYDYFIRHISTKELLSIEQHNVFSMGRNNYDSLPYNEHTKLDFTRVTKKLSDRKAYLQNYKDTAQSRTTGKKILVLGCTANGEAFKNLPIGQEVDELECNELLTTKNPSRGVWIWGNGEPIMLVNDVGFIEYKITTKLTNEELLTEIGKAINLDKDITKLDELTLRGLLHIIGDMNESSIVKANLICENLNIEKRVNRQNIYVLLEENLVESN